jgi:hypothetical protein
MCITQNYIQHTSLPECPLGAIHRLLIFGEHRYQLELSTRLSWLRPGRPILPISVIIRIHHSITILGFYINDGLILLL